LGWLGWAGVSMAGRFPGLVVTESLSLPASVTASQRKLLVEESCTNHYKHLSTINKNPIKPVLKKL
jgi:hypothetical protein